MEKGKFECAISLRALSADRGVRKEGAHGFRVHANIPNSEALVLPDLTTKTAMLRAPRRKIITVGAEDFHCTEVLFQPNFFGKEPAASTTLTLARFCTSMTSGILFQRILLSG